MAVTAGFLFASARTQEQTLLTEALRRRGRLEREEQIQELGYFIPDGVTPPGMVTLGKGALRVSSDLFQCSPPESHWPWGKGGTPLLCAPQDLAMPHNLLRKQKWLIVSFFGEVGVGMRKVLGAGFIQIIKGVCRGPNRSELLPLPYVLCADPGWFQWRKWCRFSKGHFLLPYHQGTTPTVWKAGWEGEGRHARSGMSSRVGCGGEGTCCLMVSKESHCSVLWPPRACCRYRTGITFPSVDTPSFPHHYRIYLLHCLAAHICAALLTLSFTSHRVQRYRTVRTTLRYTRVWQCRC